MNNTKTNLEEAHKQKVEIYQKFQMKNKKFKASN